MHGKTVQNASTTCANEEEPINYEGFDAFETIGMVQIVNDCYT